MKRELDVTGGLTEPKEKVEDTVVLAEAAPNEKGWEDADVAGIDAKEEVWDDVEVVGTVPNDGAVVMLADDPNPEEEVVAPVFDASNVNNPEETDEVVDAADEVWPNINGPGADVATVLVPILLPNDGALLLDEDTVAPNVNNP